MKSEDDLQLNEEKLVSENTERIIENELIPVIAASETSGIGILTTELKPPPIGLCPKNIWERNVKIKRLNEVSSAIARYYQAGLKINPEWIEEYNELVEIVSKY